MSSSSWRDLASDVSSDALKSTTVSPRRRSRLLPPILCQRDKRALQEIRDFIDGEKALVKCPETGFNGERFAIYSEAFSKVIGSVTVYRDVLADIKREYEECIAAIGNSHKEESVLRNRVAVLSNVSTTIAMYRRRHDDLTVKLESLDADNERLQAELDKLCKVKREEQEAEEVEREVKEEPVFEEEKRPIPGLTVEQWTDEDLLQQSLRRLDEELQDIEVQKRVSYVPSGSKRELEGTLRVRLRARDQMQAEIRSRKVKRNKMRVAKSILDEHGGDVELRSGRTGRAKPSRSQDQIAKQLMTAMEKQISTSSDKGYAEAQEASAVADHSAYDLVMNADEELSKEKEAEAVLEYIDKFSELFDEQAYDMAAVHAANSPRGVLLEMEVFYRFQEVSKNYKGKPTPLMMFVDAVMCSAGAQRHRLDHDMSVLACRCVLDENMPEMMPHWVARSAFTPSVEIGHMLVEYSKKQSQHRATCLEVAYKMYKSAGAHLDVCRTLNLMGKLDELLHYARHVACFTRGDCIDLLKACPSKRLAWKLFRPTADDADDVTVVTSSYRIKSSAMPVRMCDAVCALIDCGARDVTLDLLDSLHRVDDDEDDEDGIDVALHQVVYSETDGELLHDDDTLEWTRVAHFCWREERPVLAMEISAAQAVKCAIVRSIIEIGNDEKEEFDYYT